MMKKVISAKANDDFTLDLVFSDGALKRFDAKPYLDKGVFKRLRNVECFKDLQVTYGTVNWRGELDIAPETLYAESESIS